MSASPQPNSPPGPLLVVEFHDFTVQAAKLGRLPGEPARFEIQQRQDFAITGVAAAGPAARALAEMGAGTSEVHALVRPRLQRLSLGKGSLPVLADGEWAAVAERTGRASDGREADWWLARAPRESLEPARALLRDAGLTVATEVPAPFVTGAAWIRALRLTGAADESVIWWELGDTQSHLAVLSPDGVQRLRAFDFGLDVAIDLIRLRLELRLRGAAVRLFFSDTFDFSEHSGALAEAVAQRLGSALDSMLADGGRPSRLVVTGLPPRLKWFEEAVAAAVGLERWTPPIVKWRESAGLQHGRGPADDRAWWTIAEFGAGWAQARGSQPGRVWPRWAHEMPDFEEEAANMTAAEEKERPSDRFGAQAASPSVAAAFAAADAAALRRPVVVRRTSTDTRASLASVLLEPTGGSTALTAAAWAPAEARSETRAAQPVVAAAAQSVHPIEDATARTAAAMAAVLAADRAAGTVPPKASMTLPGSPRPVRLEAPPPPGFPSPGTRSPAFERTAPAVAGRAADPVVAPTPTSRSRRAAWLGGAAVALLLVLVAVWSLRRPDAGSASTVGGSAVEGRADSHPALDEALAPFAEAAEALRATPTPTPTAPPSPANATAALPPVPVEGPVRALASAHPDFGAIEIEVQPPEAEIMVEGFPPAQGRFSAGEVPPGPRQVRASLSGHRSFATTIDVEAGAKSRPAPIELEPETGGLLLVHDRPVGTWTLVPAGANGADEFARGLLGTEAIGGLPPGRYRLAVETPPASPWQTEVVIRPGETARLEVPALRTGLRLTSEPAGAQVVRSGAVLGTTPLVLEGVEPGPFQASLQLPGHVPVAVTVEAVLGREVESATRLFPLDHVFTLAEVDEAPAPVVLTGPRLSREAANLAGRVVVGLVVDRDGRARQASLVESPSRRLGQEVLRVTSQWRFRPAELGGVAVACRVELPLDVR